VGIGLSLAVIFAWGGVQSWRKYQQSQRAEMIDRMMASSRDHEQAGELGEALVELDAVLELARQAGARIRSIGTRSDGAGRSWRDGRPRRRSKGWPDATRPRPRPTWENG
jgi:hypothetical protein